MLTLKELREMEPNTIFATGLAIDESDSLYMTGSGKTLRWVAVRGGIFDWAIYCQLSNRTPEQIRDNGDKVHREEHIRMLVPCEDDAFKMYRY